MSAGWVFALLNPWKQMLTRFPGYASLLRTSDNLLKFYRRLTRVKKSCMLYELRVLGLSKKNLVSGFAAYHR